MALLDNLNFASLSESQKTSIQAWTGAENSDYIIQLQADDDGKTCLPISNREQTNDAFERYLLIQGALQ